MNNENKGKSIRLFSKAWHTLHASVYICLKYGEDDNSFDFLKFHNTK